MNRSFMQSLDQQTYDLLQKIAIDRNMTLQRLIEGVVVFEWLEWVEKKKAEKK